MIQLVINHRGEEYKGKKVQVESKKEFEEVKAELEKFIKRACQGDLDYMSTGLENEADILYLTKQTIMECVFTIKTMVA